MKNKEIERLIKLYIKGHINYEELKALVDRLEKKDDLPEPPVIH